METPQHEREARLIPVVSGITVCYVVIMIVGYLAGRVF